MKLPFFPLFMLLLIHSLNAQNINDFGFETWLSPAVTENGSLLDNPWTGGMNNIQFGEIDFNNDGFNDLIAFDRIGNRILPFIFDISFKSKLYKEPYKYDPSYRKYFPDITNTMQIHDYNNDQLPDIFTYTTGGIMVYRNISQQEIKFEKAVKQFIRSLQGNTFTNLLVTDVDYPAICDLDNDGDLDILTFWGLGSFIELHQNMSIETYGTADSLLYHNVDNCWGNFIEGDESNAIILDTCLDKSLRIKDRHTGSTLSILDINNDEISDLLLGDVDFMNVKGLINTGTAIDGYITSVIDSFPVNQPINIPSFPSMQQIDAFNDGKNDMVVSSFDPSLIKSKGNHSVWLYNINESGILNMISDNFLQQGMIDKGLGSYPVLADINNDMLIDLIIGNFGELDSCFYTINGALNCDYHSTLSLYINTGSDQEPSFTLKTNDLGNLGHLSQIGLIPAFADLNNDHQKDMVIGTGEGELAIFYNTGYLNDIPEYGIPHYINTTGLGKFLAPAIEDIDGDGLVDLIVGNKVGKLDYYRNTGNLNQPEFTLITDYFGQVNVTDSLHSYSGYSVPALFRDKQNKLLMVVGSESGMIHYFPEVNSDPIQNISQEEDVFATIKEGIRSSVSIRDLNMDGYPDMAVGNYSGGVCLYKGTLPLPESLDENTMLKMNIYPNPSTDNICIQLPSENHWNIQILDIYGNTVLKTEIFGKRFITETKKMRSGLYIVVASQNNIFLTGKLIVIQ